MGDGRQKVRVINVRRTHVAVMGRTVTRRGVGRERMGEREGGTVAMKVVEGEAGWFGDSKGDKDEVGGQKGEEKGTIEMDVGGSEKQVDQRSATVRDVVVGGEVVVVGGEVWRLEVGDGNDMANCDCTGGEAINPRSKKMMGGDMKQSEKGVRSGGEAD